MADIYTVLMNSLRKRDIQNPVVRERVYVRGRMALIRKLWGHRPRLSDREIEDKMAVFDLAVAFVESDVTPTLPATGRTKRQRETAARLFREQQIANLQFDFTEGDVDAEAEPAESDRLAYRSHVRQAAARITQWTDKMVEQIDPLSVDLLAFAHGPGHDEISRGRVASQPEALHETVLVEPVINISGERRGTRSAGGLRLLRTFFPQGAEASPQSGDASPGRMEVLLHRTILFFERMSVRLYEAGVEAERARKQRTTPRVRIRPPGRAGEAAARHRSRLRRRLIGRFLSPAAALLTVGLIVWGSSTYGPAITAKIGELTSAPDSVAEQPTAPDEPKEDIAGASGSAAASPEPDITLFDGRDSKAFVSSPANPIRFATDDEGGYARVSSSANQTADARLIVEPPVADQLAGRSIHVVVTARSSAKDGTGTVRFAYQAGEQSSPFTAQPLGAEYRRLELVWTVPGGSALGQHALLVEPGLLGGGTAVDIQSVVIYFSR